MLVTSTSEVYGTAKYVPIDENHPFQGQSPYSATTPIVLSCSEILINPLAVSLTKLKSLVGVSEPSLICSYPAKSCVIIVGMTALADCLGPYVLKGLTIVTGKLKLR